ncbi:MSHA biogenesis protein MshP [Vibrio algivorus]|uniref:MSHA biogenesis protein MshP n=1 Tax=Vibrio algivorus TaxID=1667024 RepID=A0A557PD88_9VIBR|nr:MSHA biogenesis protein MshP [Vibrio algivorus]TVO38629.1 MSHA biogenesis protein MshP [Vibrio algivorus]
MKLKDSRFSPYSKQSGSVLIVVIFVVVVMGLLAGTMARLEWSNQDTQSREILGNRAWFMAHSANEWGLTQLYPLNQVGSEPADIESRCNAIDSDAALSSMFADEAEYNQCSITTFTCTPYNMTSDSEQYRFFKLHAEAQCGESDSLYSVHRSQDVVVKAIK